MSKLAKVNIRLHLNWVILLDFAVCADFFQNRSLQYIFSGTLSECQTDLHFYQQTTEVAASKALD